MPKSRIFNVVNMFLTLFAKIKFSQKFPNHDLGQHVRMRAELISKLLDKPAHPPIMPDMAARLQRVLGKMKT